MEWLIITTFPKVLSLLQFMSGHKLCNHLTLLTFKSKTKLEEENVRCENSKKTLESGQRYCQKIDRQSQVVNCIRL